MYFIVINGSWMILRRVVISSSFKKKYLRWIDLWFLCHQNEPCLPVHWFKVTFRKRTILPRQEGPKLSHSCHDIGLSWSLTQIFALIWKRFFSALPMIIAVFWCHTFSTTRVAVVRLTLALYLLIVHDNAFRGGAGKYIRHTIGACELIELHRQFTDTGD